MSTLNIEEIAANFQKNHRGTGKVTKVNDYCFLWETLPDKSGVTKTTVYYLSFFANVCKENEVKS